jgi:hypothetical protein
LPIEWPAARVRRNHCFSIGVLLNGLMWTPLFAQSPEPGSIRAEPELQEVVTQSLPGDEQLLAAGARIGKIEIQVDDVFDTGNPKESSAAYRAANWLHINSRESTIRPQLLFKSGDPYSRHVLDETARNLRARRYLEDASITVTAFHPESNTVDVLVRVHDVWTLNPGASLSRSGGENRSGFQLEETNLLGLGKAVSVDYVQDVDRDLWKYAYRDPNVLSTRWEMEARYHHATDGELKKLSLVHPFYSLDTRWSGGLLASQERRLDRRYQQGVAIDQYQTRLTSLDIHGGWSAGLRVRGDGPGWVQRWSLGWRVDDQQYAVAPVLGTSLLPADQRLRYPWLGLSWFEDRYVVARNRDQIERTEDVYMGRALNLRVGYTSTALGADRNGLILAVRLQDAYALSDNQSLFVELGLDGRREFGLWQGTLLTGGFRYDWRQGRNSMLVVKFNHARVENPADSQQLHLGSDEGLRGYPLRFRSGNQRNVLIVEQRAYTRWQILRLLSVGGAAFVDVGRIRGGESLAIAGQRTFADAGFGLRLGNIRSSRGEMFNLDLAYPINATGADRKLQFSVTTKSSF